MFANVVALVLAGASGFEDLTALDARLAPFGASQPIDARLKLPKCDTPPAISEAGPRALSVRCPASGWRIFVPRLATKPIAETLSPPDIRRGDLVELAIIGAGYSITTPATALEDGRKGQRLRLKTDAKAPVIAAVVTGNGQARLENAPLP